MRGSGQRAGAQFCADLHRVFEMDLHRPTYRGIGWQKRHFQKAIYNGFWRTLSSFCYFFWRWANEGAPQEVCRPVLVPRLFCRGNIRFESRGCIRKFGRDGKMFAVGHGCSSSCSKFSGC